MAQTLISESYDVNKRNKSGLTPLMINIVNHEKCSDCGLVERVTALLEAGADVNARTPEYNCTALMMAIDYNLEDVIELLLLFGADPNAVDGENWVPLTYALYRHSEDTRSIGDIFYIVKMLIEAGADVNRTVDDSDELLLTKPPLLVAIDTYCSYDLANVLIRGGANVDAMYDGSSILSIAVKKVNEVRHSQSLELKNIIHSLLYYGANPLWVEGENTLDMWLIDHMGILFKGHLEIISSLAMRIGEYRVRREMYKRCLSSMYRKKARMISTMGSMGASTIICDLTIRSGQRPQITEKMVDYLGIRDIDNPVEISEYAKCIRDDFEVVDE